MGQLHNELRGVPGLLKGIRNALALIEESGVERLGETLTPTYNPWQLPEHAFLRGELRSWNAMTIAAVAGQLGAVILRNDSTNIILVVDEFLCDANARIGIMGNTETLVATAAAITRGKTLDSRAVVSNFQPSPLQWLTNSEAVATLVHGWTTAANDDWRIPIVVHPGFSVVFETVGLNTAMGVRAAYRERAGARTELVR